MGIRTIIFRGKRKDNNEWVEGFYVHNTYAVGFAEEPIIYENHYIYSKNVISEKWFNTTKIEVIPETVGQYTGLTDKNDKKIFEGDILKVWYSSEAVAGFFENLNVYYDEFYAQYMAGYRDLYEVAESGEVIGNIYDNAELLGE